MTHYQMKDFVDLFAREQLLVRAAIYDEDAVVSSVTYDSKEAQDGSLFFCKGAAFKEAYLKEAVVRGAVGYVSETEYEAVSGSVIIVSDIRKAMAAAACFFYDHADQKLRLVGITGTKGKSTTAYYFKYIFDEYAASCAKKPCGIVSTIDTYDGKSLEKSSLTTPEALVLHRHFHNAVESGLSDFVMEVSSQALKYDRVTGVHFKAGVFLNISEDHISPMEHTDFEDYFSSKLALFAQSEEAYINTESDYFDRIQSTAQRHAKRVVLFGKHVEADYQVYDIQKTGHEIRFFVRCKKFDAPFSLAMSGLFNVENALAAICVCTEWGIPLSAIQKGLRKARTDGRMETYTNASGDKVAVVDYAHNKLSFEKLFSSMKEEYPGYTLIAVFGCPGNKAYNRRAELGTVAEQYCDRLYLTMDDPAMEKEEEICAQIQSYLVYPQKSHVVYDRGEAIHRAIVDAPANSVILITGKGNEGFQKIGNARVACKNDAFFVQRAFDPAYENEPMRQIDEQVPSVGSI